MMTFDPKAHLVDLNRGRGAPRMYLEAKWRLVWFREENPRGVIQTSIKHLDDKMAVVKATVYREETPDSVYTPGALATGLGMCRVADSVNFSGRYVEKAETAAISRALAALGYGTQFSGDEYDDTEHLSDSPVAASPPRSQATASSYGAYQAQAAQGQGGAAGAKLAPTNYPGKCYVCAGPYDKGDSVYYQQIDGKWVRWHEACDEGALADDVGAPEPEYTE